MLHNGEYHLTLRLYMCRYRAIKSCPGLAGSNKGSGFRRMHSNFDRAETGGTMKTIGSGSNFSVDSIFEDELVSKELWLMKGYTQVAMYIMGQYELILLPRNVLIMQ